MDPTSQLDNNYASRTFNTNNWNATQIKGEQKMLSAFRGDGMHQIDNTPDSQTQQIRYNMSFSNPDTHQAKNAAAIALLRSSTFLSHE